MEGVLGLMTNGKSRRDEAVGITLKEKQGLRREGMGGRLAEVPVV